MKNSKILKLPHILIQQTFSRRPSWLANFRDVTFIGGAYLLLFFTALPQAGGDLLNLIINLQPPALDQAKLQQFARLFLDTFPLITSIVLISLGLIYRLIPVRRHPIWSLIIVCIIMYTTTLTGTLLQKGHISKTDLNNLMLGPAVYQTATVEVAEKPVSVVANPRAQTVILKVPLNVPGAPAQPMPTPTPYQPPQPALCYYYASTGNTCQGPIHFVPRRVSYGDPDYPEGLGGAAIYAFAFVIFPVFWARYGPLAFCTAIIGGTLVAWAIYKLRPSPRRNSSISVQ